MTCSTEWGWANSSKEVMLRRINLVPLHRRHKSAIRLQTRPALPAARLRGRLNALNQMFVDIRYGLNVSMSHERLDALQIDPLVDQHRCVEMPEMVLPFSSTISTNPTSSGHHHTGPWRRSYEVPSKNGSTIAAQIGDGHVFFNECSGLNSSKKKLRKGWARQAMYC